MKNDPQITQITQMDSDKDKVTVYRLRFTVNGYRLIKPKLND